MKTEKKGIFSALNAEQSTLFISFKEAMMKLAEDSEDSFSDIAKTLLRIGAAENTFFWDATSEEFEEFDGFYIYELLLGSIRKNTVEITISHAGESMDPDYVGWMREEFILLLKKNIRGYMPPASLNNPTEMKIPHSKIAIGSHSLKLTGGACLDQSHPRYSAKLAAAIQVWEAMEDENLRRGKSAMSAMATWLEINHQILGLVQKRDNERNGYKAGDMNKTAISEVAKICNWEIDGGAPPTPGE